jgi:hypothetical protein
MATKILQIRAAQMAALREVPLLEFEARLMAHLWRNFGAQLEGCSAEQVGNLVREGLRKARRYEIASRTNVRRFVEHMVGLGPEFDEEPWAQAILASSRFRETDKLDRIDDYEQFEHNRQR